MIEEKQIPLEYVSIRHIWLKGIEDCRKAISQMANLDAGSDRKALDVAGARTIIYSVDALDLSLVNHGEALIEDDIEQWKQEEYYPLKDKLWADVPEDEDEDDSLYSRWYSQVRLSKQLYKQIIHVLNKYNMLFESTPKGYSNVIMKEVIEDV